MHWPIQLRRIPTLLLAFSMTIGLISGVFLALNDIPFSVSVMRTAVLIRVSIVGILSVQFLPFLLSAFAVYTFGRFWIIPICSLKAFSFGYTAAMVSQAFGDAGWLARWLLLNSSCMSLPLLIWFGIRHLDGKHQSSLFWDFGLCAALVLWIGSLDYRVISPFLVNLID